ncbi:MAG: division/cell wall cluster transcriptional repressor MraZ [Rhodospirillales bacterium]|nr:division/cell wall cluster transcriptional repressor MraZ [Rhodospirillales bacterium]MBI2978652.1 division/cell wall cluster transcriptional repressor MraZ [Rhodospirillales bacterium]
MPLFVGRYVNRIDKKGRVSVPKPFRDAFEGQSFNGLYVYPLFKFNAFEACGEEFMNRLSDSLDDLPMFSDEQDDLSVILESAHRLPFDPEGRVVLPAEMLKTAAITSQVLFVGRGQRFQIWEPKTYDANRGRAVERARARGATLRLRKSNGHEDS